MGRMKNLNSSEAGSNFHGRVVTPSLTKPGDREDY